MTHIEKWIEQYKAFGVNLIPLKSKDKAPIMAWKEYQRRKATESEVKEWKSRGIENYGVVCGRVSGNLTVIDVDKEDLFSKLNLGELASGTFTVKTGKGYHIYLRTKEEEEKRESLKWKEREEIRFQGEGTYVVSAGSVHPTGKKYEQYIQSPLKIEEADSGLFDEIEKRWKRFHGLDKIEEKEEITKWKSRRSRGLEDFKSQVSLKEIVRYYVSEIEEYGSYFKCYCPIHKEGSPSFAGYKETNTFYCFGCDRYGDVITLVKEIEGEDFLGAIRKIEKITGLQYFEEEKKEKKSHRLIRPSDVEEMILDGHKFATLRDTEEVIYYKNGCWRFDGEAVVRELIERILTDLGQKETVTNYFRNEVIGHLKSETYIERKRLNAEKMKANLLNGVYDIETETLLPHDSNYYFTYCLPVNYNKDADCKKIKKFISEVLHEEDIEVVIEFIGYCLIQKHPFHKALMFLGEGANGKSTFIELIRSFLGRDNTTSHTLQSLIGNRFLAADLYGRLANMSADIPPGVMKGTGLFKMLTGGDMVSAEKKFKSPFTFINTAKLVFSANRLPPTLDDTDAFFRRWILINFPNKFEGDTRDVRILETLTTEDELSGFLNLVLLKLKGLLERGRFSREKSTKDIRQEYLAKSDPIHIFVEECLEEEPNSYETKEKIYSRYVQFCRERKLPSVDKSIFGKRLPSYIRTESAKRRDKQRDRVYCWTNIRLKEQEEVESIPYSEQQQSFKREKDVYESQGNISFVCDGCGKVRDLQQRNPIKSKYGQTLYVCSSCLEAHHSDPEVPYSCDGCGTKWKSLKDWIDHLKRCDEFQMSQVPEE